jgi:VanZ family protein
MINKKRKRIFTAIIYFFIVTVLFCLPGSAFPPNEWLAKIWFDKWVHIAIFIGLTYLFCSAFSLTNIKTRIILWSLAILYGMAVEIVQELLIVNRSFDWGDWIADGIGGVIGLWLYSYIKK